MCTLTHTYSVPASARVPEETTDTLEQDYGKELFYSCCCWARLGETLTRDEAAGKDWEHRGAISTLGLKG